VNGPERRRSEASVWRKPSHERLSISKLFEHMDPQPRSYRDDAYEDAQKITHAAPARVPMSSGSLSALVAGGVVALFVIFVAGFLSAVLIFGEPNAGGELAILPPQGSQPVAANGDLNTQPKQGQGQARAPIPAQPANPSSQSPSPQSPTPTVTSPTMDIGTSGTRGLDGLVTTATADQDQPLAPAPEVAAAETARDTAMQSQQPVFTAPQTPADGTLDSMGPMATIVTDTIIYPGAKPVQPAREETAAASSRSLGGPGGNYSLQFGAFRDKSNAAALVRELNNTAKAGIVAEEGATGATLFYVRAGAFQTRAEALEAVKALRTSVGIVTFVHANRGTG
jgi:cell division septation protein DedD